MHNASCSGRKCRGRGLVGGLHVVGIQNLQELLNYCCEGKMPSLPSIENQKKEDGKEPDFSEVQGQTAARRAALIAAAGFHNLLMLGPPGGRKSMIARRIPTIMPPMSEEEQMEVTRIYSIAGMLAKGEGVRRGNPSVLRITRCRRRLLQAAENSRPRAKLRWHTAVFSSLMNSRR